MLFEKVHISDILVILVLGIALIMAIFYRMNELAMSIASGMIGYIGGSARTASQQDKRNQGGK